MNELCNSLNICCCFSATGSQSWTGVCSASWSSADRSVSSTCEHLGQCKPSIKRSCDRTILLELLLNLQIHVCCLFGHLCLVFRLVCRLFTILSPVYSQARFTLWFNDNTCDSMITHHSSAFCIYYRLLFLIPNASNIHSAPEQTFMGCWYVDFHTTCFCLCTLTILSHKSYLSTR